jgi:hypothetical protein
VTTKKDRRHSGRKTISSPDPDYPTQFDTYDDWKNYRDGQRAKHKREEKKKIKKQVSIRKARKVKSI